MLLKQRHLRSRSLRAGFSIVEIGIVIGIIGLLIVFLLPRLGNVAGKAQTKLANVLLTNVKSAISSYQLDVGKYPTSLEDLVSKPSEAARWEGPYIDKITNDPWGNPLQYESKGSKGHPFELYSYGPQGEAAPEESWMSVWDIAK